MAIMTFDELDQLVYDWLGGESSATKVHKTTRLQFDEAREVALYVGDFTEHRDDKTVRHFPCVVIDQKVPMVDRERLYSVTDLIVSDNGTDVVETDGPIPYKVLYMIHFFTRSKRDSRQLATLWAQSIEPFGIIGDENANSYYAITNQSGTMNESYGDQVVYHDVVEIVLHIEVANATTRTYKKVTEATVAFTGDREWTVTEDESSFSNEV
jgi:hypothetical protein